MTLEQMASAARSDIGSGLREVTNFSYSIEQIYDEISNVWGAIVDEMTSKDKNKKNRLIQYSMLLNREVSYNTSPGALEGESAILFCEVPKLASTADNSAIISIGVGDYSFQPIYDPKAVKSHRYNRVTKNRPFVFVDISNGNDGNDKVYFYNMQDYNVQNISIRGVFADPVKILSEDGILGLAEEFPAPRGVQQAIINKIVAKFIKYYREMNPGYQTNNQVDSR